MKKIKRRPEAYIDGKLLSPESLMMSYGYSPSLSEGSIKPPIFQTSTFAAKTAEDLESFFKDLHTKHKKGPYQNKGLVYSRINNPDLEILEDRLTLWDDAEACAVFSSGMAAITAICHCFLKPGDLLLHSEPLYGGTDHFLKNELPGVRTLGFSAKASMKEIEAVLKSDSRSEDLAMIWTEPPANPTNWLVDLEACAKIARRYSGKGRRVKLVADNTFLGPLWQHPLQHGVHLVVYSATKYIGGHSDLIAGAVLGSDKLISNLKGVRKDSAAPFTCWLMMRSLETLKLRMTCQMENAHKVGDFLKNHRRIERTYYLGHLEKDDSQLEIYKKQCVAPGAMISFDIKGGKKAAFRFLNSLKLIKIAVSLGSTESLAEHVASTTHSNIPSAELLRMGIGPSMIRLSVGVEDPDDLILDLKQALEKT